MLRHLRRQLKALAEQEERGQGAGGEVGLDDRIYLEPRDPDWRSAWEVSEGVIRLMRDEVEERGSRFLLMTLSNAIQVNPDRALRERYAARIGARDLFYPDRRLAAFAREEGIASLVLAPKLRAWAEEHQTCVHGFQEPWLCQGHWNAHGHRVAGEILADRLCRELGAARPSPAVRSGSASGSAPGSSGRAAGGGPGEPGASRVRPGSGPAAAAP
jgi:hypothetical protein